MALLSPCPQLMAVVASTLLGLIRNMRAFGGILVVSVAAMWAWVGWALSGRWAGGWASWRSTRAGSQSVPFVPDSFPIAFKSLLFSGSSAPPRPSLVRGPGAARPEARGPDTR